MSYNSNYYDPVGSQSNQQQPQGYRYQTATGSTSAYPPSSAAPSYNAGSYRDYGSTTDYSNPQQARRSDSEQSRATAALSRLPTYNSQQQLNATSSSGQYAQSSSAYNDSSMYSTNTYSSAAPQTSSGNRAQLNASPLYANSSAPATSTYGRLSYSADPASTSTTNYPSHGQPQSYASQSGTPVTAQGYQSGYAQPSQQNQPPRYNSPMQAVQAQQQRGHSKQPSRGSEARPSPQMNPRQSQPPAQRQPSASAGSASTTVDPSHVYDIRAEQQRKANIEAEKRRRREEADAARKAEEDRLAAVKKAEEDKVAAAKKAEEDRKAAEKAEAERRGREAREAAAFEEATAKKKAVARAKAEQKRLAKEEKKQSKTAATALQKMASSGASPSVSNAAAAVSAQAPGPPMDEESEMRAMFQKMREYNQKNPAMLARLWDEERKAHNPQSPQPTTAQPAKKVKAPVPEPSAQAASPAPRTQKPSSGQAKKAGTSTTQPESQDTAGQPGPAKGTQTSNPPMVWPPGRKGYIAEHATRWLLSQPENQGKSLSSHLVVRLLDSNPSYVQLCEALERTGITINRAAFARELLKAVPHGGGGQKTTQPSAGPNGLPRSTAQSHPGMAVDLTSSPPMTQQNGTVAYEAPRYSSLGEAAREVNNMAYAPEQPMGGLTSYAQLDPSRGSYSSPYFAQPPGLANGNRPPSQSQPPMQSSEPPPEKKPSPPPRPPANKEEAARKRTFGDLVDLTMGDSDEDAPPKKVAQTAVNVGRSSHAQQSDINKTWDSGINKAFAPLMYGGTKGLQPGQIPIHPSGPSGHALGSAQASLEEQRRLAGVPAYLKPPAVGSPAPAIVPKKSKGPSLEHLQRERIKGKLLVEPIMRDRVARRSIYDHRTIARDVLLATGRHPDMRGLNGHLATMQKLLGEQGAVVDSGGTRADLGTIRWDVLDPNPPKRATPVPAPVASKPAKVNQAIVEDTTLDGEDADDEGDFVVPSPKAMSWEQPMAGDASHAEKAQAQAPDLAAPLGFTKDGRPRKRRGRKPRASLPVVTKDAPDDRASPHALLRSNTTPRKAAKTSTPASAPVGTNSTNEMAASGTPVGYAAFRQFDADGNQIKKKGRPVGWRKDVHSRAAAGLTPAKQGGPSGGAKGRRASTAPYKDDPIPEAHYEVYDCKWQGCEAELHNLDVLKKHIVKVHGRKNDEGLHACLWEDCDYLSNKTGRNGTQRPAPAAFDDIGTWLRHVDKYHLQEVAWKLGDGPKGGLSDHRDSEGPTGSEAYLSDAKGRSATPVLRVPNDDAGGRSNTHTQTLPMLGAKPKKDPHAAAAELETLKATFKTTEAAMLGRGGSRVVDGNSILGFLDDEDFHDIVEAGGESSSESESEDELNGSGNDVEVIEVE